MLGSWVDDFCAIAYRPNPREPRDFQGGINDHAPLVQFKRRVLEDRARRNASSPDQDVGRHCFPIATVHCTVCVRENSGVELDLNLPLPEFLLGIETKRFAQFRKDHRSTMDQDDPQLAGINPAVVREDVAREIIDSPNSLHAGETPAHHYEGEHPLSPV